jgi:phenylacetate-CoA ligase
VVDRGSSLDTAAVRVEYDPASKPSDPEALRIELREQVQRRLKSDTNITFEVEILDPGTLERAVSKAQRVVDKRKAAAAG